MVFTKDYFEKIKEAYVFLEQCRLELETELNKNLDTDSRFYTIDSLCDSWLNFIMDRDQITITSEYENGEINTTYFLPCEYFYDHDSYLEKLDKEERIRVKQIQKQLEEIAVSQEERDRKEYERLKQKFENET